MHIHEIYLSIISVMPKPRDPLSFITITQTKSLRLMILLPRFVRKSLHEKSLREKGGSKAIVEQADLTKTSEIKRLFENTMKQFNQLDILINTAGMVIKKPFVEISETRQMYVLLQRNDSFYFGLQWLLYQANRPSLSIVLYMERPKLIVPLIAHCIVVLSIGLVCNSTAKMLPCTYGTSRLPNLSVKNDQVLINGNF